MPNTSKNTQKAAEQLKKSSNVTRDRLARTPFDTSEELKEAKAAIRKRVWNRLEELREVHEQIDSPEFSYIKEHFKKGWGCAYGSENGEVVTVSMNDDERLQIKINEEMKSSENNAQLLGVLIRSMTESFQKNYMAATGLIPPNQELPDELREVIQNMGKR